MARTMTESITLDHLLDLIADKVVERINGAAPAAPAAKAAPKAAKKTQAEAVTVAGEDDEGPWTEESLMDLERAELKELADSYGIEYVAKVRQSTLVAAILEAQEETEAEEEAEEEDEAEEEEDEEEEDDEVEDEADEEEEDEEESDEDDDEFWTRADLEKKSIGDLKGIAREYNIKTLKFKNDKEQIIAAILSA